jgi:ribulose-bisphosphate carboxylase large chain
VGLETAGTAEVAPAAVRGGLDLIKDDETPTNLSFCPLVPRLEAVMNALDKVEKETGKKAFYAAIVTAGADSILERAGEAVDHGGQHGHGRCPDSRLLCIAGALPWCECPCSCAQDNARGLTRDKGHGISMAVISKTREHDMHDWRH